MRSVAASLLIVALGARMASSQASSDWTRAEKAIVRLPPSAFRELPRTVRSDLVSRRCSVPQTSTEAAQHNVVHGSFLDRASDDWAVVCSRGDSSSVLVYHQGRLVASLGTAPDLAYLQSGLPGSPRGIGFSRLVRALDPRAIRARAGDRLGDQAASRIDHEAIEDVFLDKASTIWYFTGGRWRRIRGSD